MFFTQNFRISLSMLSQNTSISTKGFLSILQDIAEMHSASIGYGITDIDKNNFSWALLNWKVKIFSRPLYGDTITVKTWARHHTKLHCYRDFEVFDSNGNTIAIVTSKWILIDIAKSKVAKIEDSLINKYNPESTSLFNIIELDKLSEPQQYTNSIDYRIRKSDIDINNHVNNLCYIDIALEAFTKDSNVFNSYDNFEIQYKHQIKIDDKIKVFYALENEKNYVVIKNESGEKLHSIIKFY